MAGDFDEPGTEAPKISSIIQHVQCEIGRAVQDVVIQDYNNVDILDKLHPEIKHKRHLAWIDKYVAEIILNLTLDETTAINAGVTFNTPMPNAITNINPVTKTSVSTAQNSSVGLSAAFSTRATRKDTLAIAVPLAEYTDRKVIEALRAPLKADSHLETNRVETCHGHHKPFIEGDLKFREWLEDVTLQGYSDESFSKDLTTAQAAGKKDVIQHEITFVITYSGGVTPGWKLVRVSANQGSQPFLNGQRMNTQDVTISMGPPAKENPNTINSTAQITLLASQLRSLTQGY